jgi:signal transduction histidine kinase
MTWRRRLLFSAPVVLFVLAWVPIDDPAVRSEPLATVADAVTGWILVAAGLVAWGRRRGSTTGPLLVVAGYLWYVGDLYFVFPTASIVPLLSFAFRGLYDVVLAFVLLSFPGGRLETPVRRVAVAAVAVAYAARSVAFLLIAVPGRAYPDNGIPNPFLLGQHPSPAVLDSNLTLVKGLLITLVAIIAIDRWRRESGAMRRVLRPVLIGGVGWAVFTLLVDLGFWVDVQLHQTLLPWAHADWWPIPEYLLRGSLAPLGFLAGAVQLRTARSAVVDLISGIDRRPVRDQLEPALRRALGDPTLTVVFPEPEVGGWVDASGSRAMLPDPADGRAVTRIETVDRTLGAIVHDPSLLEDPGLVSAIAATLRLAIDNEQLTAALEAQLEETRASRRRIVEAGDAERQRIERDLHDGAQQRLVSLAISLRMLSDSLGDTAPREVSDELTAASLELRATIEDLRELAHGLDPAILREGGLGPAIRSLAERCPTPTHVEVEIEGRLPRPIENAAYFVVAEALTNVAKHAVAGRATVRARQRDGRLIVEVEDDGRGGASQGGGAGLRGLADRVAAAGGSFEVSGGTASGTRLRAELPCA